MNELALFAGAGGGILGAHLLGWRTICAVEKEPYCREVLLRRQRDGMLPLFPIWDDCNTFDGRPWRGLVDVVTAGFPCQPFSFGGKQDAEQDSRDGWPATIRILGEVKPRFALLENVPGLLSWSHGYFGRILGGLAEIGYDAVWDCLPASAVGAPHRRDRLWVLAYPSGIRCRQDAKEVSFVSVTQAFNTTTSMGRLTLNVLLSFAQFEREVTGERIRDKIAVSKKKGMWMGGPQPLG